MQKGPPTPKGFRDISPGIAKKKREIIDKIASVLEEYGFEPLETPTIEFAQTLEGKYGEEEKLIYKFEDRGGRKLALRYDLTVPLARYVANNPSLKFPFRRYQIGQVFRGENPQAGRYREFTQFDFDTVGSESYQEDAHVISAAIKSARKIGLGKAVMAINDRQNFKNFPLDVIRAIDKIHKIERDGVEKELREKGYRQDEITKFIESILNANPTNNLEKIFEFLHHEKLNRDVDFFFDETLARGLDYYTGAIFELKIEGDLKAPSLGAGGRYDNLIGSFVYPANGGAAKQIPAVGFSFGLDRILDLA